MFQTEIYIFIVYSCISHVAFSFCPRREDQLFVVFFPLFFASRGARGYAVVLVNYPFSDHPFFGSEESIWSEITNPFLDSPKKTHKTSWCLLSNLCMTNFPHRQALGSSERKRERAREGDNPRVSPSRAPVFSCAHYFQALITQAILACSKRSDSGERWEVIVRSKRLQC